jgi:TP901 family phage tail tape measure protein
VAKKREVRFIISAKDRATAVFNKVGSSIRKLGGTVLAGLQKTVLGLTAALAALGVAATALAVKSVSAFGDYETALADMVKVTDLGLDEITQRIQAMPAELGSSTQLVKGFYQTISAGVTDPVEAMGFLEVAAKTAKAAHLDVDTVIKALSKTMKGFAGSMDNATQAADLLFAIEKVGQTNVTELANVIGDLSGLANALNIEFNDMGGALALITQTAGNTDTAATQLQAIFTSLLKPTSDMTAALKKMGFESADAALESLGFKDTLKGVIEATDGSKEAIAALFGNVRALKGVVALSADGFRDMEESITAVEQGVGGLETAYTAWKDTLAASTTELSNTFNNLLTKIGQKLAPVTKKVLDNLSSLIQENEAAIVETAGTIAKFIEDNMPKVEEAVKKAYTNISGFIKDNKEDFKKWASAVQLKTEEVINAVRANKEEITAVAAATVDVGTASVDILGKLVETVQFSAKVWGQVTVDAKSAFDEIEKAGNEMVDGIDKAFTTWKLSDFLKINIIGAIKAVFKGALEIVKSIGPAVKKVFLQDQEDMLKEAKKATDIVGKELETALDQELKLGIDPALSAIKQFETPLNNVFSDRPITLETKNAVQSIADTGQIFTNEFLKERQLLMDNAPAITAIDEIKSEIDSIPRTITVTVNYVGKGSTARPIMDKIAEIKDGMAGLSGKSQHQVDFSGQAGGRTQPIGNMLDQAGRPAPGGNQSSFTVDLSGATFNVGPGQDPQAVGDAVVDVIEKRIAKRMDRGASPLNAQVKNVAGQPA